MSRQKAVGWSIAMAAMAACSPAPPARPAPKATATSSSAAPPSRSAATTTSAPSAGSVARPTKPLTVAEARAYMVALVNRDRAKLGLAPVSLDDGAATRAGQAHADDMARLGYLGHWGSDGSVPEQRHTEAGGVDMVLENALCYVDERTRTLDADPRIDPAQIERAEQMFFEELPPNDGHRRNILKPSHTRVGIGIAQPVATPTEIAVPCIAQEFVDGYGEYEPLPREAKVGATLHVAGRLAANVAPTGVGLARVDLPVKLAPAELNKRRTYPVPRAYQMYWTKGFVTPIPLDVQGDRFAIDVPLSDGGKPGLYEVSVWAKLPGATDHTIVGLRTIVVR